MRRNSSPFFAWCTAQLLATDISQVVAPPVGMYRAETIPDVPNSQATTRLCQFAYFFRFSDWRVFFTCLPARQAWPAATTYNMQVM
jgi:hypothetical protein